MADIWHELLNSPLFLVMMVVVAVVVAVFYFMNRSPKRKVIQRSDIEREKFIENMDLNTTTEFKKLYHGNNYLGGITRYKLTLLNPTSSELALKMREYNETLAMFDNARDIARKQLLLQQLDDIEKAIELIEEKGEIALVFKPKWFWTINNPFAKLKVLWIPANRTIRHLDAKSIIIPQDVALDRFMGFFYDHEQPKKYLNIIHEQMFSTDIENYGSAIYNQALDLSTVPIYNAHDIAKLDKQQDLIRTQKGVAQEKM